MVNTKNNEIRALSRLLELTDCFNDMIRFLVEEGVLDKDYVLPKLDNNHAQFLQELLSSSKKKGKLQLLSYTWKVLPKEALEVTVVTAHAAKNFCWHQV